MFKQRPDLAPTNTGEIAREILDYSLRSELAEYSRVCGPGNLARLLMAEGQRLGMQITVTPARTYPKR